MTNREPQSGEVYTDAAGITREVQALYSVRLPFSGKQQIRIRYDVPSRLGPIKFTCSLDEWQIWAENAKRVALGVTG
jgi:hypothetical protein